MGPNKGDLKYKTFDSLLADIFVDLKNLSLENMIEPQELIRVAKWVTKDLGLRVYKTKEVLLELHNGKIKLPDDFYVFNYGMMCGEKVVRTPLPQGTTITEIPYPTYQTQPNTVNTCTPGVECPTPASPPCGGCQSCDICAPGLVVMPGYNTLQPYGDPCVKPRVFMDCKGGAFELVQIVSTEERRWKFMLPLRLVSNNRDVVCGCPNLYVNSTNHIWIKDNFLYSNLSCGKIYLNYQGSLEDEEGNLLVPDHEILTLFYEYKLKQRIFENLLFNGEDVERILNRVEFQLKIARKDAKSLVNMPNFYELQDTWRLNRKMYNARYVDMFRTNGWC